MTAVFVILGTAEPEGSDPAGVGDAWGAAAPPRPPCVTFDRAKVTKARRGPTPEGQEAPGPLSAQ